MMLQLPVSIFILTLLFAVSTLSDLHQYGVCCSGRLIERVDGVVFDTYLLMPNETQCACEKYRAYKAGDKQWQKCPDCFLNDMNECQSDKKHIGGDELLEFCQQCNSTVGSVGN